MRISHDVLYLLLGVIATSVGIEIFFFRGMLTMRTCLSQPGIFLDFNAPAFIVREVQLESVDFVLRHQIDKILKERDRVKMPPHI